MDQKGRDEKWAELLASQPKFGVGLLGVEVTHPELAMSARLDEIERRILAIETAMASPND